ncbi:hypothetical protein ACO02O_03673 [Dirofilaria immitis]
MPARRSSGTYMRRRRRQCYFIHALCDDVSHPGLGYATVSATSAVASSTSTAFAVAVAAATSASASAAAAAAAAAAATATATVAYQKGIHRNSLAS